MSHVWDFVLQMNEQKNERTDRQKDERSEPDSHTSVSASVQKRFNKF